MFNLKDVKIIVLLLKTRNTHFSFFLRVRKLKNEKKIGYIVM